MTATSKHIFLVHYHARLHIIGVVHDVEGHVDSHNFLEVNSINSG